MEAAEVTLMTLHAAKETEFSCLPSGMEEGVSHFVTCIRRPDELEGVVWLT